MDANTRECKFVFIQIHSRQFAVSFFWLTPNVVHLIRFGDSHGLCLILLMLFLIVLRCEVPIYLIGQLDQAARKNYPVARWGLFRKAVLVKNGIMP